MESKRHKTLNELIAYLDAWKICARIKSEELSSNGKSWLLRIENYLEKMQYLDYRTNENQLGYEAPIGNEAFATDQLKQIYKLKGKDIPEGI